MDIPFTKMHGIGNDFIMINESDLSDQINMKHFVYSICHRNFGIGADGLMVLKYSEKAAARMDYYNSDGSGGEMCGNGLRCFSRYVDTERIKDPTVLTIETAAGIKELVIRTDSEWQSTVSVNMGMPIFHSIDETIVVKSVPYQYSYMTMGVPHVVIFLQEPNIQLTDQAGPIIEKSPQFKRGANVNFCYIENESRMQVYTWERGSGHTLACGTGITSAFALAVRKNKLKIDAEVHAEGGVLRMALKNNQFIEMTGPAKDICCGKYLYDLVEMPTLTK